MRAAAAALSVAAYHEDNVERMGRAAPDLIPVLVSLLPHLDPEVQAHAATALANLAHGSPSYQSEAGEAGAIGALLDICRGRAGVGGCDGVGDADGGRGDGQATAVSGAGMGTVVGMLGVSDNRIERGGEGAAAEPPPGDSPRGKKRLESNIPQVEDPYREVQQGGDAKKDEEKEGEKEETGDRTGEKWAQTRDSEKEEATGPVVGADGRETGKVATRPAKKTGGRGGQGENAKARDEGGEGLMAVPQPGECVEDKGGEEGGAAATMDVDAVQAATAALANLLCYSEANSVRLVAAGGIGVLVGLVSSYRPQNLLDFDQVCISLWAGELGNITEFCLPC